MKVFLHLGILELKVQTHFGKEGSSEDVEKEEYKKVGDKGTTEMRKLCMTWTKSVEAVGLLC